MRDKASSKELKTRKSHSRKGKDTRIDGLVFLGSKFHRTSIKATASSLSRTCQHSCKIHQTISSHSTWWSKYEARCQKLILKHFHSQLGISKGSN